MFDPALLRTFLAVVQTRNFTQAARRLGLRQSTVSQQVRRLEAAAGRQLFARDTHSVVLTTDGEALVPLADSILAAHERAASYFAGAQVRGRVRFGASEDFVLSRLPEILRNFRASHPLVDLELTVGLSGVLYEQYDRRELDLVFAKRRPGETRGQLVWRERLAWIGGDAPRPDPSQPVPLIVYPPPSITRAQAMETLERHGRSWRITCTSGSLSGLRAAAMAGLGVTAHAHSLIPPGLRELPAQYRLPDLGDVEFVLLGGTDDGGPVTALSTAILAAGDRLHRPL
ncbi:MAG TPA: LysR substrate-binding domain-containing protein [Actinocatenispora sp.]